MAFLLLSSAILHITSLINSCFQQSPGHKLEARSTPFPKPEARHIIQGWAFDETVGIAYFTATWEGLAWGVSQKHRAESNTASEWPVSTYMSQITIQAAFTLHGLEILYVDFSYHDLLQ